MALDSSRPRAGQGGFRPSLSVLLGIAICALLVLAAAVGSRGVALVTQTPAASSASDGIGGLSRIHLMAIAPGGSCDDTAVYDCATNQLRRYLVPSCRHSYTIPELYPDFAAHQVEWNIMGKTSAFWSVLTGENSDDAAISPEAKKAFYQSGIRDVTGPILAPIRRLFPDYIPSGRVLDFGCGLGRLSHGLRLFPNVTSVTCVDQSVFHIDKARAEMPRVYGGSRAAPVRLVVSTPDLVSSLRQDSDVPVCYEYVQTIIVMQHMIRPLQAVYLEQFCDLLAAGGVMAVQIPYMTPMEPGCTETQRGDLRKTGGMQMHWMAKSDAQWILKGRGCKVTIVDLGHRWLADKASPEWGSMMLVARKLPDEQLPRGVKPCVGRSSESSGLKDA